MSRTETRRVDISCTRDKNVLLRARARNRNENRSAVENSRTQRDGNLPNEWHSRAKKVNNIRTSQTDLSRATISHSRARLEIARCIHICASTLIYVNKRRRYLAYQAEAILI